MAYDARTMIAKVLSKILAEHSACERKQDRFLVEEGTQLTLFVAVGSEALEVERVRELSLLDDWVMATTARGEQYHFAYDDLGAVRFTPRTQAGYGSAMG